MPPQINPTTAFHSRRLGDLPWNLQKLSGCCVKRYTRRRPKWQGLHVRFGSKADICSAKWHVRFTPESGHVHRNEGCPLWAISGHLLFAAPISLGNSQTDVSLRAKALRSTSKMTAVDHPISNTPF